jgi:hypothetical protein
VVLALLALVWPGAATAKVEMGGESVLLAQVVFADPADCADGDCDAVFLTASSGVLGAASNRVVIDDTVLVEPMTVAVVDGELWPVEEPTDRWCTQDASIAIDRNLRSATVTTTGLVELGDLVWEDSWIDCVPNGHWLDLTASFTGTGETATNKVSGLDANPWLHGVYRGAEALRSASVTASLVLDGQPGVLWPDSAMLARFANRLMAVHHEPGVGRPVARPLKVPASVDLEIHYATGVTDGWGVDLQVMEEDGVVKTYLGVWSPTEPIWGDGEADAWTVTDDLSTFTASGKVMLFRWTGEEPEPIGPAEVTATWTGTGDAWAFTSRSGAPSSEGGANRSSVTGIHRDAELVLMVDGDTAGGVGYLGHVAAKFVNQPA